MSILLKLMNSQKSIDNNLSLINDLKMSLIHKENWRKLSQIWLQ